MTIRSFKCAAVRGARAFLVLAAVATGLLAAGLFLSDLAYVATPGKFVTGPLLTAHNLTSILRVGASLGLFGYQAGRGLRQATYQ